MNFHATIDAIGLKCPLPILKTKKAISLLNAGEVLKITATDKGATKDFHAFCKQTGHQMLGEATEGNIFTFFIKKRND